METSATRSPALAVLLFLAATGSTVQSARAQEVEIEVGGGGRGSNGQAGARDLRVDLHGSLGWYSAVGVGFRVDITIVHEGLLEGVEEDLSISPGAELFWFWSRHYGETAGLWPLFAFQWNFYLSPAWTIFPELGVVLFFLQDSQYRERYWKSLIAPFAGFGARWWFSPNIALLMRVGWPAGIQVGIVF
jgi:hypothetical protein